MRDTISSGIGSLPSVMASHVRRSIKCGADAPRHFVRPLPGRRSATIRFVGGPLGPSHDRISISFDLRTGPWSPSADRPSPGPRAPETIQSAPPRIYVAPPQATASLQGHVQILVKSGIGYPPARRSPSGEAVASPLVSARRTAVSGANRFAGRAEHLHLVLDDGPHRIHDR